MTVVRTFYRQLSVFVTVPKVNEALRCVRGLLQREPDHSQVEAEDFVKVKQAVPVHIAELQHRWRQVLVIEVVCYLTLKTKNLKSVVKRILKACIRGNLSMGLHPCPFLRIRLSFTFSHLEQRVVYQFIWNQYPRDFGKLCKVYYNYGLGQRIIREEILLGALCRWANKTDSV